MPPGWGKNLTMLNNTAAALLASDPYYNVVFSVHPYWSIECDADEAFIRRNLQQAVNLNYPLVVGEFCEYGLPVQKAWHKQVQRRRKDRLQDNPLRMSRTPNRLVRLGMGAG